jgi:hypothetical protein
MRSGYYFKHGVPTAETVMTEYFTRLLETNGDQYILVTAIVDDPQYLTQQFIRTLVFKPENHKDRAANYANYANGASRILDAPFA